MHKMPSRVIRPGSAELPGSPGLPWEVLWHPRCASIDTCNVFSRWHGGRGYVDKLVVEACSHLFYYN